MAPPISSAVGVGELRIDQHHDEGAGLERQQRRPPPDLVGEHAEHPDAERHAADRHRGPQRRLRQAEAEPRRQIARQPDHHAVVAEVLHRAEDEHAEADLGGRGVLHQHAERRHARAAAPRVGEDLRLADIPAHREGDDAGNEPDEEHAAPADRRQQQRRHAAPRTARRPASRARHRSRRARAACAGQASATSAMPMPNSPPRPRPAMVR